MNEKERAQDWVRFLKLQFMQSYMLEVLLHLDEQMRARVLGELGMKTAMDVFDKLPEPYNRRD